MCSGTLFSGSSDRSQCAKDRGGNLEGWSVTPRNVMEREIKGRRLGRGRLGGSIQDCEGNSRPGRIQSSQAKAHISLGTSWP